MLLDSNLLKFQDHLRFDLHKSKKKGYKGFTIG